MALFSLIAKLGIDTAQYQAGLKKAESAAQGFGSRIKSYLSAGLILGASRQAFSMVTKLAGEIKDSAEKFNLTTQEVQKLRRAAQDSGVSFEQLANLVNKVTVARAKAAEGEERYTEAFEKLGVSSDRFADRGVRSADVLMDISEALRNGTNDFETQSAVMKVLGDDAGKLFGVLKGINDAGPIVLIDEQQIEMVDRAGKVLSHLKDEAVNLATVLSGGQLIMRATEVSAASLAAAKVARALGAEQVASRLEQLAVSSGTLGMKGASAQASGVVEPKPDADKASAATAATDASQSITRGFGSGVSDPLAKIGGLFFGADSGMRQVPRQQLDELKKLNARVERIEQAATAQ